MDGISRSRGWDQEIPHCVLPMEQLVLSDKWARKLCIVDIKTKHEFGIGTSGAGFMLCYYYYYYY